MQRSTPLAAALLLLGACGDAGSYELRWSIGCDEPGDPSCEPRSIMGCSRVGLDSVRATTLTGTGEATSVIFPCYSPDEGPVGRGPGLDPGIVRLEVTGLSPAGLALTPVVRKNITIPETGLVRTQVNLETPPQCGDGVDNDWDGLVDLLDPGCDDVADTDESS
jgi:hypothetical protein